MSIDNPEALVEAFKGSGEFDRFQKELLAEFQKDASYSTFKADIGDIVRQRLAKDQILHCFPQDVVGRELTQEVERYPIVDRAVKDMFSDPGFHSKIQNALQRILREDMQKRKLLDMEDVPRRATGTIPTGNAAAASNTHETCLKERLTSLSRPPNDAMDVDNE